MAMAAVPWEKLDSVRRTDLEQHVAVAPRPTRLADTGLELAFVADLLAKHLETKLAPA